MVLMFQRDLALTGHSTTEGKERERSCVDSVTVSCVICVFSLDLFSLSVSLRLFRASPLLPCPIDAAIPTAFWLLVLVLVGCVLLTPDP